MTILVGNMSLDRYLPEEQVAKERIAGLPALVKFAWNMALLFPDLGDEIIADLLQDIQAIIDRESVRMAASAQAAANTEARDFWLKRVDHARRRGTQLVTELAAVIADEGIDPRGWYVYIFWAVKGDDRPLYVGRSGSLLARLGSHMREPQKRYGVGWVTLITCKSEQAMIDTEGKLISHYKPHWNVIGIGA